MVATIPNIELDLECCIINIIKGHSSKSLFITFSDWFTKKLYRQSVYA